MIADEEPFKGLAFMPRIRYRFRRNKWIVPLLLALIGFVVGFFIAPVSAKGNSPDKMTAAFTALLAAGITLVVLAFTLARNHFRRLKPVLIYIYAIFAVVAPLLGVLPGWPDSFYSHLWGAPLVLGLAVAGTMGIFLTLLVAWTEDRSS
jgi:cell division protein FtsW (lipid II flippase)